MPRAASTAAAGIAGKRYGGSLLLDVEKKTKTTENQTKKKNAGSLPRRAFQKPRTKNATPGMKPSSRTGTK